MLFHDVVRDDDYDLWLGDEAWELDYFLHENPELKTSPFVVPDRLRRLAADRRAGGAADGGLQRGEHRARRALSRTSATRRSSSASAEDVTPAHVRAGPAVHRPTGSSGTSTSPATCRPFDPADYPTPNACAASWAALAPLIVAAVGGSAVGRPPAAPDRRRVRRAAPRRARRRAAARVRAAHRPESFEPVDGMTCGRLRPRPASATLACVRSRRRPGRADDDDGARGERAGRSSTCRSRTTSSRTGHVAYRLPPLRRARADAVRADVTGAARGADACPARRCRRLPGGRTWRCRTRSGVDRTAHRPRLRSRGGGDGIAETQPAVIEPKRPCDSSLGPAAK